MCSNHISLIHISSLLPDLMDKTRSRCGSRIACAQAVLMKNFFISRRRSGYAIGTYCSLVPPFFYKHENGNNECYIKGLARECTV